MATNVPVTLDTPIAVKILFRGQNKKYKLLLKDTTAAVLPGKLKEILGLAPDTHVVFERFSDSNGKYVILSSDDAQVYKTLFRAAKAKLKLRLRATVAGEPTFTTASAQTTTLQPTVDYAEFAPIQHHRTPIIARSPMPPPPQPSTYQKPSVESAQVSPASPVSMPQPPKLAAPEGEAPRERSVRAQNMDKPVEKHEHQPSLALRIKEAATSWVVFCNHCDKAMENEHFHCSICEEGDYDLCPSCVIAGVHCPGSGHWMVKRFVSDGRVENSTTERIAPKLKSQTQPQAEQGMPGAFMDEKQSVAVEQTEEQEPDRTCNCCVKVLPERKFVTCMDCEDYDLCMDCHISNRHGHHPGHPFKAATPDTEVPALAKILCNAGRNVRHNAVCDGCEKYIYGVRHKCLNCPDWDYCSECIKESSSTHPQHRFVPIYAPLSVGPPFGSRHYGIYCDGPLCKSTTTYIEGVRYKCAVCHDTDFCANCEALPTSKHNHTHPLIKFKTPVRGVSVTTHNEGKNGAPMLVMGDRMSPAPIAAAPSTANAATQVQTLIDVKPAEDVKPKTTKDKLAIRELLSPVQEKIICAPAKAKEERVCEKPAQRPALYEAFSKAFPNAASEDLDAHFIRDTISDGTKVGSGMTFVQVWTLRNPGPTAWPAGCSVRYVGGDNMLNVDHTRALSAKELSDASESNIVDRDVMPGEEISFRIMMKAGNREGTAVSYWRLKTASGTPFGHRLWCDIQVVSHVVSPASTSPTPLPLPPSVSSKEPANDPIATPSSQVEHELHDLDAHLTYEQEQRRRKAGSRMAQRNFRKRKEDHIRTLAIAEQQRSRRLEVEKSQEAERVASAMLQKLAVEQPATDKESQKEIDEETMRRVSLFRELSIRREQERYRLAAQMRDLYIRSGERNDSVSPSDVVESIESPEPQTAELPVEEKPVEAQAESSGMIFPQLDKESPASSTHEAVPALVEVAEARPESTVAVSEQSDDEFFEDAESLESVEIRSFSGEDDDESFMTDEEYDILNASDEDAT